MAGDRDPDRFGANFALRRLDAGASTVLKDETGRLAILDDVDAEPVGGARVAPGDRVVAGRAAAPLPDAAVGQIAGVERLGHQRQALADFVWTPEFGVDAVELHGVGDPGGDLELGWRVGHVENAALAQHHIEIELARQALVEPEREVVESDRFGIKVVRPHDRRVAAGVAAAEPALFDHADAGAIVGLGEVIGGREAMSAAADDDEIIGRLGLRLAPGLRPTFLAGEALPQESKGGIARAHPRPREEPKSGTCAWRAA